MIIGGTNNENIKQLLIKNSFITESKIIVNNQS